MHENQIIGAADRDEGAPERTAGRPARSTTDATLDGRRHSRPWGGSARRRESAPQTGGRSV